MLSKINLTNLRVLNYWWF